MRGLEADDDDDDDEDEDDDDDDDDDVPPLCTEQKRFVAVNTA